jgi:hypothetical protein
MYFRMCELEALLGFVFVLAVGALMLREISSHAGPYVLFGLSDKRMKKDSSLRFGHHLLFMMNRT